jgi:hypothetical protein
MPHPASSLSGQAVSFDEITVSATHSPETRVTLTRPLSAIPEDSQREGLPDLEDGRPEEKNNGDNESVFDFSRGTARLEAYGREKLQTLEAMADKIRENYANVNDNDPMV